MNHLIERIVQNLTWLNSVNCNFIKISVCALTRNPINLHVFLFRFSNTEQVLIYEDNTISYFFLSM